MEEPLRNVSRLLTAAAFAAAATALLIAPASAAASVTSDCSSPGAYGSATWTWGGKNSLRDLRLTAVDTADDSRIAGVRLYTLDAKGNSRYWQWRLNSNGSGSSQSWNTSLDDARGITRVGVEAAAFTDGGYQRLCGSGSLANPYR
ncbi:hypothetical protein [Streptomyces sp. NBC_00091]|uniref:hypothetical protein n=1 Tax=Streptomyces sp. NBC_00091 TaxID=2975648 RepID=UPI00224E8983|nr:hypothetical protein [Streptomyces sp. NBC_00091]MCX5377274.1 hypothetical protein [Streptomyces sp. NBC_00091]